MELSYAAYNYPNETELPVIPGAFMGDFTQTAEETMAESGFVNIVNYNYDTADSGAHTIGWRIFESADSQLNENMGGNNDVGEYSADNSRPVFYNLLDRVCTYSGDSCRIDTGTVQNTSGKNYVVDVSLPEGIKLQSLVVVDIRGSVTINDWLNNIITQIDSESNRFAALADEVFTNVENYITANGLEEPVILVTGHSLGAAIANILAARLNAARGTENIYAYTFATPRTVNEAVSGNQAIGYPGKIGSDRICGHTTSSHSSDFGDASVSLDFRVGMDEQHCTGYFFENFTIRKSEIYHGTVWGKNGTGGAA